jgi:hypothetical protein
VIRIFRDRVPDKEYPVGTIRQLISNEAMVKYARQKFPNTNGWKFFDLDEVGAYELKSTAFNIGILFDP